MNRRSILVLVFFASLSAWASAQSSTAGLSAGDQLKLLSRNRALLDDLLDRGLAISDTNTPLKKVQECQRTADRLGAEFQSAVSSSDSDRIAEIGDHLKKLVTDALVPNLKEARQQIPPGSQDYEELQKTHSAVFGSLSTLSESVPTSGPLSKSRRVQDTRDKLKQITSEVGQPPKE